MTKKNFYAVVRGRQPGIYDRWFGKNGAQEQVQGYTGARYKGFAALSEAINWFTDLSGGQEPQIFTHRKRTDTPRESHPRDHQQHLEAGKVVIYTDGGTLNNPGPGGYGVVILAGNQRKELSGGFRLTTNNRMELMACIVGLQTLKKKSPVVLYSDSRYVVNGINQGWARRWKANRWMRTKKEKAENVDLWKQLLALCDYHDVEFVWVRGHAGTTENERCDQLANAAARGKDLPVDAGYERQLNDKPTLFNTRKYR